MLTRLTSYLTRFGSGKSSFKPPKSSVLASHFQCIARRRGQPAKPCVMVRSKECCIVRIVRVVDFLG